MQGIQGVSHGFEQFTVAQQLARKAENIVGFYNCVRLHSTLGDLAPSAYEHLRAAEQPIGVSEIA